MRNLMVCPRCGHHARLTAHQRLGLLLDRGSFRELYASIRSRDVLAFPDEPPYEERLADMARHTGHREAVVTGLGRIGGVPVAIGVFDFYFMGGSMGSAVGEKLTRLIERATTTRRALVLCTASGGARMQEGMYSLLQMAKLTGALAELRAAAVPYVSVLTDPTTGGVAASIALLGDVQIAEPAALIGFAGPRVMGQTLGEDFPESFQRAEFLLQHGFLDAVVERRALRDTVRQLLRLLRPTRRRRA